ncbi:MAG: hypothetical protein LBB45_02675 [Methanobrevibacter sp.]|jgi:hypothetical protein|nr:hypothetical protein [Candidatus Methanovirga basalitermitum]
MLQDDIQKKFIDSVNEVNLSNSVYNKFDLKQHSINNNTCGWKEVSRDKPSTNQSKRILGDLKHLTAHTSLTKNKYKPKNDFQDLASQHDGDKIKLKPLLESKSGELNKHKIINHNSG